ncbi:hypothetical protein BKD74_07565 [Corynebacterium diphtheriae]|nr:Abi family protein [Corynebacterium diphtheriae str. Aberdeen]KLN38988.1 hypothetical protein AL08_09415 [Corynebacterium diphtheriae bv. gravis str. ISS 4746]KLN43785.1 hypothetical protein AL09_09460 [Corynebacterium diphtheriae bv. gravis str. ISS 4749]ODS21133.1 hypothetical protein BGK40_08875 [Corynebacterium diphtheriae]OWN46648.1 hypothetical protein AY482_08150 [Corynebacterium diphtheriae bv. gravis]
MLWVIIAIRLLYAFLFFFRAISAACEPTRCARFLHAIDDARKFTPPRPSHRYRENSVGQALKKATSIAEQIQLLRHRGMNVDETLTVQLLANVSYYRLSEGVSPFVYED